MHDYSPKHPPYFKLSQLHKIYMPRPSTRCILKIKSQVQSKFYNTQAHVFFEFCFGVDMLENKEKHVISLQTLLTIFIYPVQTLVYNGVHAIPPKRNQAYYSICSSKIQIRNHFLLFSPCHSNTNTPTCKLPISTPAIISKSC